MNIWEANSLATVYMTHPCSGEGVCDPYGCGFTLTKKVTRLFTDVELSSQSTPPSAIYTVITQFLTADGTVNGNLKEIRHYKIQNEKNYSTAISNKLL